MSLIDQIVLMDFEVKDALVMDIPGARVNFKNPDSGPKDINGNLIYVAPNMLKNITNAQFERNYEFGTIFDLLHCSWPCWLPGIGNPVTTLLASGVLYLAPSYHKEKDLTKKDDLKQHILWEWQLNSQQLSEFYEIPQKEFSEKYYYPKEVSDIGEVNISSSTWLYSTNGGDGFGDETTTFYFPLSPRSVLTLNFSVNVLDKSLELHPELNDLKHKIVIDYLKHVIVEPLPQNETAPA